MPGGSSGGRDAGRILGESPGRRSGRRAAVALAIGDASSSDEDDGPIQDLLAGGLSGLSAGARGLDSAAAAAGAQGVLVKDILSAEEQLRVSKGLSLMLFKQYSLWVKRLSEWC